MAEKMASQTTGKPIRCRVFYKMPSCYCSSSRGALGARGDLCCATRPHEVRIRIICTSLCHTDVSLWQWKVINEMSSGGADYCFECVGNSSVVQEAYACCRKAWGKTIVLGVDKPGAELTLSSHAILLGAKSLIGSLYGGVKPKSDIPNLIKSYMDEELQLDGFITHEVKFDDINDAFSLLVEGKSIRCIIWMDK